MEGIGNIVEEGLEEGAGTDSPLYIKRPVLSTHVLHAI